MSLNDAVDWLRELEGSNLEEGLPGYRTIMRGIFDYNLQVYKEFINGAGKEYDLDDAPLDMGIKDIDLAGVHYDFEDVKRGRGAVEEYKDRIKEAGEVLELL